MPLSRALEQAEEAGLDLVEVAPNAKPPVAKIVDWKKLQYEKAREERKNRNKNKQLDVKQVRFGLKIGQHDLDIKLKKARSFLEKGHMVKFGVFFRGREITHPELGEKLLRKALEQLDDIAQAETKPQLAGKHMNLTVRRKK